MELAQEIHCPQRDRATTVERCLEDFVDASRFRPGRTENPCAGCDYGENLRARYAENRPIHREMLPRAKQAERPKGKRKEFTMPTREEIRKAVRAELAAGTLFRRTDGRRLTEEDKAEREALAKRVEDKAKRSGVAWRKLVKIAGLPSSSVIRKKKGGPVTLGKRPLEALSEALDVVLEVVFGTTKDPGKGAP